MAKYGTFPYFSLIIIIKCHMEISKAKCSPLFKGVHLGERIVFPGGRGRKLPSLSNVDASKADPTRLTPNILKNSKADKKASTLPTQSGYHHPGHKEAKTVVEIIGLEKSKDQSENGDSLIDLSEGVQFLQEEIPGEHKGEEQPMFQLENLENLQLVVPEDSGEPRIIIPESGIKLTIQSDLGNSERKVLHLIPDSSLPETVENTNQDIQNIDLATQANLLQLIPVSGDGKDSGNMFKGKSEMKTSEVLPIEYPQKIVYKKVSEASSSQLMSVSDLDRKMDLIPVHHQQFKCDKCNKFFISKEFLDKHLHSVHTEIPSYNISIFNPNVEDIEDSQLASLEDIESIINFNTEDTNLLKTGCIDVLFSNPDEKTNHCSRFQCKTCKEYFNTKQDHQRHRQTYHKKPVSHKCCECGAQFTSNQTLKSHIQTIHEGIKKVCSVCLKPVVDLTRHIRVQHKNGDKRDFHCDICDSKFR